MEKNQRKIPKWMQIKKENRGKRHHPNEQTTKNTKPFDDERNGLKNFLKKNSVDSSQRFDHDNLSFVSYNGKIHYLKEFHGIAEAIDKLLTQISIDEREKLPVAFDMEWTFDYVNGPSKTDVVQLCCDLNECFVIQLTQLKKIPASLSALLNHPKVVLHGVNIKNDFRKLERDFPTIKADPLIEKCVDLGTFYNQVFNTSEKWSLERLCIQTLKMKIDKSRQIRMSKWNYNPLSKNQLMYASLDVYVSKVLSLKKFNL